jgi:hypothetical protein
MSRTVKLGTWAAAVCACIALCGVIARPALSAFEIRYATNASVDAKLAEALTEVKGLLLAAEKDNTEFWIQFLDFKANRGEANDFDMTMLAAKLRQQEELLKK